MRGRGITYDTGFLWHGSINRTDFDPEIVKRELQVIRDDLHCNAVRVCGGDADRLELAARQAVDLGLEVWFSPYPLELTTDEMLTLFADCAGRAERLRQAGGEVVFVTGAELSLMAKGFLPGDDADERVASLTSAEGVRERVAEVSALVNDFLAKAVAVVRERFGGKVTYASIQLERVDWEPFDIASFDAYRSAEIAEQFADGVQILTSLDKPVAITEFGTATYEGAGDRGARVLEVVEHDEVTGAAVRLDGEYRRDEEGQAAYLRQLLEVFEQAGVDSAFVFMFALYDHVHRPDDPRRDLDLASLGVVKVLADGHGTTYPGMPWEPKVAFHVLGELYKGLADSEVVSAEKS